MKVGVVAYNSGPSGFARESCVIALAPLPPSTFSTIIVSCMMRDRCGAIERRKTSLPPPGLEWVIRVTTVFRLEEVHAPISADNAAIAAMKRIPREYIDRQSLA